MAANNQYKNSVFSFLFSDPAVLRELCGALSGVELAEDVPIVINTLENILYKNRQNDISFTVGGKVVVLIEHQSTINPNMPLRILEYIAEIFKLYTAHQNIYGTKLIQIPWPEFFVFYNGTAPYPEEETLKLSDAFFNSGAFGFGLEPPPNLELIVKVYNINYQKNERLMRNCETLRGYSIFIHKVREFESKDQTGKTISGAERISAMQEAVTWCIENGVLKGFLKEHSSEVINMLYEEWDIDKFGSMQREEGIEIGREEGIEIGEKKDVKNLREYGMTAEQIALALKLPLETVTLYLSQA